MPIPNNSLYQTFPTSTLVRENQIQELDGSEKNLVTTEIDATGFAVFSTCEPQHVLWRAKR